MTTGSEAEQLYAHQVEAITNISCCFCEVILKSLLLEGEVSRRLLVFTVLSPWVLSLCEVNKNQNRQVPCEMVPHSSSPWTLMWSINFGEVPIWDESASKASTKKKRWERDCVFSGGSRNQVLSPSKAFLKPFLVFQSENRYDKCNKRPGGRVKSSHGRVPPSVRTSPGYVNNFTTSGLPVL